MKKMICMVMALLIGCVMTVSCCDCERIYYDDYCGKILHKKIETRMVTLLVGGRPMPRTVHHYKIVTDIDVFEVNYDEYNYLKVGSEYFVKRSYVKHKDDCYLRAR